MSGDASALLTQADEDRFARELREAMSKPCDWREPLEAIAEDLRRFVGEEAAA